MESTFMKTSCRAANLRPLLRDTAVKTALDEFVQVYNDLSGEDERGMRLDSVLRSTGLYAVPAHRSGGKDLTLDEDLYAALLKTLNHSLSSPLYIDRNVATKTQGQRYLSRQAHGHSDIIIHGIHYRSRKVAPRDSNIQFRVPGQDHPSAGSISSIFTHRRKLAEGQILEETFLSVRQFVDLESRDIPFNNFRKFPHVGGQLYYDGRNGEIHVLRPGDVDCHVARTPLAIAGITEPCLHVLPLDRVRR